MNERAVAGMVVVATFLALAMPGGAFLFALLLVPLHWMGARDARTSIGRWLWALVAGVAVGANAWGISHMAVGGDHAVTWLLPAPAGLAAATLVARTTRRRRRDADPLGYSR